MNFQVRDLALSKAGRYPNVVLEQEQRADYLGAKPLFRLIEKLLPF